VVCNERQLLRAVQLLLCDSCCRYCVRQGGRCRQQKLHALFAPACQATVTASNSVCSLHVAAMLHHM
jgi:hypothetical protein